MTNIRFFWVNSCVHLHWYNLAKTIREIDYVFFINLSEKNDSKKQQILHMNTESHFDERVKLFWMLIIHIVWSTTEEDVHKKKPFLCISLEKKRPKCENMICYHCYRKCDAKSRSIQWMTTKIKSQIQIHWPRHNLGVSTDEQYTNEKTLNCLR